ncbi:Fc.00g094810.m01.CDS01 [Cosmosporella sp. VM-42]
MAEVLGIVASVVALCQAVKGVSKGMGLIVTAYGAPDEFIDLSNELNTCLALLSQLNAILDAFGDPATPCPPKDLSHIKGIVTGLNLDVGELKKIESDFKICAKGITDTKGRLSIPKIKWARERSKIVALRDRVRRRRSSLSEAIALLQADQSYLHGTVLVDIQSICTASFPALTDSTSRAEGLVGDLRAQFNLLATTVAANTSHDKKTTESLLKQGETLKSSLSSMEHSIKDRDSLLSSDLENKVEAMQASLEAIGQRLEQLDKLGNSQLDDINRGLALMQNTLEDICDAIQRQEPSSEGLEQFLQQLVISDSQAKVTQVGTDHTGLERSQRPEAQSWTQNNPNSLISVRTTVRASTRKRCRATCRLLQEFSTKSFYPSDVDEEGTSLLLLSAIYGNLEAFDLILSSCPQAMLSWRDQTGMTLSSYARSNLLNGGDPTYIAALHERIVDLTDEEYRTNVIIDAVLGLSDLAVEAAIDLDPGSINERDERGRTALHWAVMKDDVESVRTLLDCKADIAVTDLDGKTPFHGTGWRNHVEIAQILINAGSDLEATDSRGRTPLLLATAHCSCDVLELLLQSGADISARDDIGNTAFHLPAKQTSITPDTETMLRLFKTFQGTGGEMDSLDNSGETPLMLAIIHDHAGMTQTLIELGADAGQICPHGDSILHYAAMYGTFDTIQVLRAMKLSTLDPDLEDKSGMTADDYFDERISLPIHVLDVGQSKPTEDEVEAFGLLIEETRERYKNQNTEGVED